MMFTLKKISKESIPAALEKAERYRFLNEPSLAESVCSDILEVEPGNSRALVTMLLAMTDQLDTSPEKLNQAQALITQLAGEYEREYYAGIICERKGHAVYAKDMPDARSTSYEWLIDAMEHFEKAEALRPTGNDDALLRWNTCARQIMNLHLEPRGEYVETQLE
jgi:hypothetical protein